jgi:hypothetical protein
MNKPDFSKTPIALAITGMVIASTPVYADTVKKWGRWDPAVPQSNFPLRQGVGGVLNVSGGSLVLSSPSLPNIPGDEQNPGKPQPEVLDITPTPPPAAHPGDWVVYSALNYYDDSIDVYAVTTGNLTMRPPAAGAEGGELSVDMNGFIHSGLSYYDGLDGNGGIEVGPGALSFSSASAEGAVAFVDAPEFIPFMAEGSLTDGAGAPIGAEGSGFISAYTSFGGEGSASEGFTAEGTISFNGVVGDNEEDWFSGYGMFVAGQPTSVANIDTLQAGNVTGTYDGFSSLFGFDVHANVQFGPGTFDASFNDSGQFGSFDVSGNITGSRFQSNSFDGSTPGGGFQVTDAGVVGTLFGPQAQAMAGVVGFVADDGYGGSTFADIFAAVQGIEP